MFVLTHMKKSAAYIVSSSDMVRWLLL